MIRAGQLKDYLNGKVKYNMESFSTQIKKSINGDEYYSTPPRSTDDNTNTT